MSPLFSNSYCSILVIAQTRSGKVRIVKTLLFYNFDFYYLNFIIEGLIIKLHASKYRLYNINLHIYINEPINIKKKRIYSF